MSDGWAWFAVIAFCIIGMMVPTAISKSIAIIKYCMASGETVSAKVEKGLMLNISTMD